MPKRLREYSLTDWGHLRPLTQGWKTLGYDYANRRYVRSAAPDADAAAVARGLTGRKVLVTIAFADPEATDWQIRLVRRYIRHDVHLVADNSTDADAAAAIRQVAAKHDVPYIRLPCSRSHTMALTGPHPSRSHGMALNWVWYNVIGPGEPAAVAFLDDDLFPTAAEDPFAPLAGQDFYGVVRWAGARWFLWAGYCVFNCHAVAGQRLDFRPDWFIGLDTGGGNWEPLYRHADIARLQRPSWTQSSLEPTSGQQGEDYVQWCNGWLHEVGAGNRLDAAALAHKRSVVAVLLAPHLAAAG